MLNYSTYPNQNMVDALRDYFEKGYKPGHFLTALLSNDLCESFGRADLHNRACMFEAVSWLYNEAPSNAWGSPERVQDWLESFAVKESA